ncbi:dipeptide epimerase [Sphingomonas sp. G124]|uniref:Dipeptide epimerase n=1 Tax=Sphingomonas cremea TaxID=2904799 RepID=A0A9X1TY53_9SPHN|nr:dipeptide epimerase [Sphingomonas cremea]MCF2515905.1 dipeptide epimerase [Sphingomonas cremea]
MGRLALDVAVETLRLAQPFRISGYVFTHSDVVVVTLHDGELKGRGEGGGVYYLGDDVPHMLSEIGAARAAIEDNPTRDELRSIMPPGGARNAVDCALWELEALRAGMPVWQLAGQSAPKPLCTTFTLGADDPEVMAKGALAYRDARSIKVKLTGDIDLDIARVKAIRAARPDVWLGVDGNQGFVIDVLDRLVAALEEQDVSLLEQPLARGREADLDGYNSKVPIAGDESLLTIEDVAGAVGRFDVVNIKLDKCGGLTEGLMMAADARRLGLGVMVGNMVGTSLAMAPAFVLGQGCDIVDLDGPTFLAEDRKPSVHYEAGTITAGPEVWGSGKVIVE